MVISTLDIFLLVFFLACDALHQMKTSHKPHRDIYVGELRHVYHGEISEDNVYNSVYQNHFPHLRSSNSAFPSSLCYDSRIFPIIEQLRVALRSSENFAFFSREASCFNQVVLMKCPTSFFRKNEIKPSRVLFDLPEI